MKKHAGRKGFTLIELMISILIVTILSSIGMVKYRDSIKKSREAQCLANRKNIELAAQVYIQNHDGKFPETIETLYNEGLLDRKPLCSEGGEYVWVSTDPPKLSCSIHYWPFTEENNEISEKPSYYFSSELDNMDGLKTIRGRWRISNGNLLNATGGLSIAFLDMKDKQNLKDYSVDMTFKTSRYFGVYYRATESTKPSGYLFWYDARYRRIYVYDINNNRSNKIIAYTTMPSNFNPVYQYHNLQIDVEGDQHNIKIDGTTYLSFKDDSHTSGTVGIRTLASQTAVDSITVK